MKQFTPFVLALLLSVLSFGLSAQVPVLDCDHPDYDALESFFYATGGEDWDRADGWITTCDPCSWYGVRCDANDRVTALALAHNNLTGVLPSTIGDLTYLSTLSAPENQLSGSLPASLFELDLWDLYLTKNNFSGSIPAEIGNLENLQYLRLDANDFTGPVPASLANLTALKRAYLNSNALSGSIPAGLSDLPELTTLFLQNNQLSGCLPEDLRANCGNTSFRFYGNSGLPWSGDFTSFCETNLTEDQVGAPCDDGDPNTLDDTINENCDCGPQPAGLSNVSEQDIAQDEAQADDGGSNSVGTAGNALQNPTPGTVLLLAREMNVYPNPVSGGQLTVNLPGNDGAATLRLLSATGSILSERSFTGATLQVQIPSLEPGMYLVEATANGQRTLRRVMVR